MYETINYLRVRGDLRTADSPQVADNPLVPDACTPQEAVSYRNRLHEIGKGAFVQETIGQSMITAKKLCTAFGIVPPSFLEDAPDEAYHPLLALAISREYTKRQKLSEYNTIDDAVELLKKSKNIIVITGAGVRSRARCCVRWPMDMIADFFRTSRSPLVSESLTFDLRTLVCILDWNIWA